MPDKNLMIRYATDRLNNLESYEPRFYTDKNGVWTVGIGFTPIVRNDGKWKIRDDLKQTFADIGAPLSEVQYKALETVAQEKNSPASSTRRS